MPSDRARFNIPDLPSVDAYLPFLRQIEENRWYSNFGPVVTAFEDGFVKLMEKAHSLPSGTLHAKTTGSGYGALVVGLFAQGIGKGHKILVPSVNFPAGLLAAEHLGATPVIADVDPQTWLLTPEIARAAMEKTKIDAVMPVSIYGIPLPAAAWDALARETGVKILIDAAAAVESQTYLKTGIVAHSLHALKPFGAGEGGLIVARDAHFIWAAHRYMNFGMENHLTLGPGENVKISEFHAAVGLAQLARWSAVKARRRAAYDLYCAALAPYQDLFVPHPLLDQAVASNLMLTCAKDLPPDIVERLQKRGVAAHQTYFPPMYRHPHFAKYKVVDRQGRATGPKARPRLVSESLFRRVIGLPFHAFMDEENIRLSVEALRDEIRS